jgi:hypothetical protein
METETEKARTPFTPWPKKPDDEYGHDPTDKEIDTYTEQMRQHLDWLIQEGMEVPEYQRNEYLRTIALGFNGSV